MGKRESVVIIGGGVSGLAAALELAESHSVTLLEARHRLGGRIHTLRDSQRVFELGAEFIHGKPPALRALIKRAGLSTHIVPDRHWKHSHDNLIELPDFWDQLSAVDEDIQMRVKDARKDRSFLSVLEQSRQPRESRELAHAFVEGFHAAPAAEASSRAILKSEESSEEIDGQIAARLDRGYGALVDFLADECHRHGVRIRTHAEVTAIDWKRKPLTVQLRSGDSISADHCIITLPIGVLRSGEISLHPLSSEKSDAIHSIEAAHVTKVVLQLRTPLWTPPNFGFIHSEDDWFPTWWSDERGDILTAWCGGSRAEELNQQSTDFILHRALETASKIFGEKLPRLRELLIAAHHHNWSTDPFSRCAYSYLPVAAVNAPKLLAKPESEALYFAGEATDLNHQSGTVHAALDSGLRAARQIRTPG
jgi:monoamine oxidase